MPLTDKIDGLRDRATTMRIAQERAADERLAELAKATEKPRPAKAWAELIGAVIAIMAIGGLNLWAAWNYALVPHYPLPWLTYWQCVWLAGGIHFVGSRFCRSK